MSINTRRIAALAVLIALAIPPLVLFALGGLDSLKHTLAQATPKAVLHHQPAHGHTRAREAHPLPMTLADTRPLVRAGQASTRGPKLLTYTHALIFAAGTLAFGLISLPALMLWLVFRRLCARGFRLFGREHPGRRDYQRYPVHLSMHDEAKPQDLEDMVESIGSIVREFPEIRARRGQPYFAFELLYGKRDGHPEWTICILCERRHADAIDAAICAAYPDVRLGRTFAGPARPIGATLKPPGHVMRFRKSRPFVYSLLNDSDNLSSPPVEAIAQAQVAVGEPSAVRFQFTPAMAALEAHARKQYQRHEDRLARAETWGLPDAGLRGTLNRSEMTNATLVQNRGMFFMEVTVAAEDEASAKLIGAALSARRGENQLRRRWMIIRQDRYRRRFPLGRPPLWPALSLRTLVSAAEVAHLLELPTARLKSVPVRRLTLPRIPAPPEVHRPGGQPAVRLPPARSQGTGATPDESDSDQSERPDDTAAATAAKPAMAGVSALDEETR